jgi:uncharacterized membrane protein YcfT
MIVLKFANLESKWNAIVVRNRLYHSVLAFILASISLLQKGADILVVAICPMQSGGGQHPRGWDADNKEPP